MSTDSSQLFDDVFRFNEDSSSIVRYALGESAVLLVTFNASDHHKPIEFTWTSNDRPLDNPKHFRITETNNSVQLAIDHVQREDAGVYKLYARTKSGETARRDIELIVEDRSSGEDPPIFLRRLSDLSVKVGTRTRLLVEIRSSTDVKTTWYRNDRRICENDRIRSVNEGNFHCIEIAPVTLEDGGSWMVQAENLGGRNSCLALISVLVPKAYKGPEFIEALRAVLTEQGTVSLECKVIGVPTPNLRWFKDSKEIKAGDVFALTANPDDPTSLGTYTCEAVNCMGKVYSSSKVHVVGRGSREGSLKPADNILHNSPPPIFTNELKNLSIRIGDTVMHGCQVVVPPWPKSVVWYNKEGRIDHNEKYRLIEDGLGIYMLEVKPSEFSDEGEWKCVVTSNEGSVGISTCLVTMDIPKNYRKPRFMESLKAVLTDEGLVSFECKVVGFPTPVLRWEKDGEELRPGDIYQLTGTNSLGTYCCIAKNCMGETSSTALLTLEDIQNQLSDEERLMLTKQNQPPKFLQGLKSQEAKINEEFKFSILVTAATSDPPVISWYRDELPIETSDRYTIVRESASSCQLEIRRVEFVDQAEWKCVAINDFGSSVTSSFLKLQIPKHYKKPRFLECLRAVMSDEGIVNLECKVIGVPQPVLKWFKDGVPLLPGDIHRIISGQDGTCCLGTYTCEARNCMGVVASSASLLGFDNAPIKAPPPDLDIQRNLSLSTINEERTSQMYDTPAGDMSIDEKGDVSFSFDGKEVSVSLYETPDLTEEEALQIVEMYADQISEHVTEHNIVELPPLRFVKETQQSGNLLMEAVVIDVDPDHFSHVEDLRTEADMDDISIMEVSLHGLTSLRDESVALDRRTEEYVQRTLSSMEESLKMKRRTDSLDQDEYFSMSQSKHSRGDSPRDDTESDLQTFASASAHDSNKMENNGARSKQIERAIQDTEHLLAKEANFEFDDSLALETRKRNASDTEGSKSREDEAILRDISGEEGDGLKLKQIPSSDVITDPAAIQQNLSALVPLAISINVIRKLFDAVEEEVVMQSALMMSPASAGGSLKIIRNLSEPLDNLQRKLNVYSGHTSLENLFASLLENLKDFHQGLSLVEKCVSMDEDGHTLVQRTSVCIVDSAGDPMLKALKEIQQIVSTFKAGRLRNELELINDDMNSAIQITQDTIKSQSLMQEASELEAAQHFSDTIVRLQDTVQETIPFEQVSNASLPPEANPLKNVCRPVVKIQLALESIEHDLSLEENEEQLFSKVHETVLEKLSQPIKELQSEICKIEKSIDTVVKDSLEEKISIAILDTVCPPMYELQKGLHVLSQQSASNTRSGMISVSVLESMVPPLQEIQNGLARLGQDVENGSLERNSPTDNLDANRLIQSFAQSVLYFQNNIESLTDNAPLELRSNMLTLKNYLSKLIETVVESGMGRYNMTVLENMKKPIDDVNYCLRQIEERSVSGSMKDLIEPLMVFREKAKRCEDIVTLSGRGKDDHCLKVLKNFQKSVAIIEKEIDKNELTREQSRKPVNDTLTILDELQECIASIREQGPVDQTATLTVDQEDITLLKSLAKPLEDIQKCLLEIKEVTAFDSIKQLSDSGDLDALEKIAQPLQDVVDSLRTVAQEQQTIDSLRSMSSMEPMSELKHITQPLQELHNCIGLIQSETQPMDAAVTLEPCAPPSLKVARPLAELQNCIGKILQQICEPLEDMSTMDDISALKTSADAAPEYADNVVEIHERLAVENVNSAISSAIHVDQAKANILIEELKECLATVQDQLVFENVENIQSKREAIAAVSKPIQELEKCLALIQQQNVQDAIGSVSTQTNLSSLMVLLEPLQVLDMNIAKIQREQSLSQPMSLQNLAANVADLKAFISEQADDMTVTYGHVTEAQSNTVQELQHCIGSINQPNVMEALESLSSQTQLSDLKQLIKPIQELQRCLEVHENVCVQEVKDFSSADNLSLLKMIADPLLELKQSIATIEMQTKLDVFELLSQHEKDEQTAQPVLELLNCVNNINTEMLEQMNDLSQDDISALKTWASLKSEAKYSVNEHVVVEPESKVSRENLATKLENLNKCMETLQRQPSVEFKDYFDENNLVMEAVAQPLEQVKQALLTIQEEENVNLEQILDSVTGPLLVLKETIQHLQNKLQDNQELAEPIIDLQTSLETTLDDIAEAVPSNVVTSLLQRPKAEIQICLKAIEEAPVVHSPEYYKDAPHFHRIGDGPQYRLEIPYAKLDFTGTYSVIATHCYGEAKAIISLQIYAKDLNKSNAMNRGGSIKHGNVETLPIFTRPLKDLRCCDGDSITLECHVEGQPEPAVIWEKDGRVLPHTSEFRTNFCDDRATLSISRVYPEDEGEYTCVASNNIGKSYTSACIIVDVPEEKENLISRILSRPSGLLSTNSTPRSTPRTTPVRSISPMPLSYRSTHIDLSSKQHKCAAPKFYAMPHNRLAEEGETVRFQCAIAGHPTPWSTWDKDGCIVTPTSRINIKERDDLRILEIEEVTMEDAGLYRITLENEYGRIEATARLDIISNRRSSGHGIRTSASPRRSISSSRRIMGNSTRIGGRLALACNFRGGSVPNKKFYHNGTEVPPTDRIQLIENGEAFCLVIDNVRAEDAGVYTCIASDESSIAASSTVVTFSETEEHTAPEFVRGLGKIIQAKECYALDLSCSVVSSDPFEMVWLRDGDVIPNTDDFRYIDHGEGLISLRIMDPFVYDSGRYTCSVRSDYGKCETSCDVIVSEVLEENEFDVRPVFTKIPQTVVAAHGTVVAFCARVSPVHAKVRWSICGRTVTEDTRGILIEHQPDGVHILHVLGLEYKHSGEIKCVAYIPTHPESSETTVYTDLVVLPTAAPTVSLETDPSEQPEIPAYIIRGPEDCSVLIGGTVTLEAIFGGYSQPKVKWYRAGRQITESTNIKIHTTPGFTSLLLTDITADQSGKYTIEVMNEHNCDISSASVSVEGPPDPPSSRPIISQGSDRLSVAWCGPPFDGGVMITGFILEIQEESNDWIEYSTVVDSLATTIKGLKPGVAYRFRVRAENANGRSAPSTESEEVRISLGNQVQTVFDEDVSVKPGGDFKTRFSVQEELGKGRFGVVHKVIEKENGRTLAAKIVKCIKAKDKEKIQEEISIMQSLRHPKLLQLAAAFENPREMIMVMEYITGGELFERVVADDFTLTERDCILFLRQICEGVDYMHNKSVFHLDLKPENIMCHNRTSHQIKIIDFGLAQRISADTPVRVLFGTPEFIPPEIINYEPIGFQSDMWSIGVICYVLLSGLSPFMGDSDVDTFSNITCADFDFDDDSFDAVSQDAKDFISSLLVHRKEKRLTAQQCLESKWLSDHDNEKLSTAKICTDKLKKFVIRRKWQKTGNAIRALGRMATLSANSRRNSAASASVPNSPRPSITGTMNTSAIIQRLTSLNEEEVDHPDAPITEIKSKNKTCNERSDSGFSECSNCSEKIPCICSHQTIDRALVITEEKQAEDDENGNVATELSPKILQMKLEEIVHTQIDDDDQQTTDSHESSSIASINTSSTSRNGSDIQETTELPHKTVFSDVKISVTSETPTQQNLSRSSSVDVSTSPVDNRPIMRSDFTNTIHMRKQWLEQNAHKEKPAVGPVTRTLIEGTGKVSQLKQRFSLEKIDNRNNNGNAVSTSVRSNPTSMSTANNKRATLDTVSNNNSIIDHSNSTTFHLDERNSYAKSIEARSPLRLDGRVKEVSSRLTTPTTTSKNDTIKRNGGGISSNGKNNESFQKAAAFWKG